MSRKGPGACRCLIQDPITCTSAITQEDLLCDDCRAGCNAVFLPLVRVPRLLRTAAEGLLGPHRRLTVVNGVIRHDL